MEWLWPIRTGRTFLDVWSIFHLCFWATVGSGLWRKGGFNRPASMLVCLAVAYGWEAFEKYAEHKWPQCWLSPESWLNSWVSDPATCVAGLLFAWYALDHWRA